MSKPVRSKGQDQSTLENINEELERTPAGSGAEADRISLKAATATQEIAIAKPLRWIRFKTGSLALRPFRLFSSVYGTTNVRDADRKLSENDPDDENSALLAASDLFDSNWYLAQNRDVHLAGVNPLLHYLQHGADEGRDPNPLFDSDWYLEQNPDVRGDGVNPLLHYLQHGAGEGRDPNPVFDGDWYLEQNPDVRADGVNPLWHYLQHGAGEGRDPNPLFDGDWYLEQNPDVRADGVNPLRHYLQHGVGEGRDPSPLFDSAWYLEQNPDVRADGVNPLLHYLQHGAGERRDPNPLFDSAWYLEQNPDVRADCVNPLLHYLQHGAGEGRDPNPLFDSDWYLEQNTSVRADGVNPLWHYLKHGASEGRAPSARFDGDRYRKEYPEVRATGINPLAHYLRQGAFEGKQAWPVGGRETYTYQDWIEAYDILSADDIGKLRRLSATTAQRPLISVVMPVYNTEIRWLRAAIESVCSQLYSNWELCISDNASTRAGVSEELLKCAETDQRIKVFFRDTNDHISANSNSALALASGEFIALLDSDDILPQHALYCAAEEIDAHPEADLIFSDEDKIDEQGRRFDSYFKPDWNPALMLSQNAFSHLGIYRRRLVEEVGGFRIGLEGSQDHDLVLRCAERSSPARIRHIPRILYHWRAVSASTAASADAKPYAWTAGACAIEEHLARKRIAGKVSRARTAYYQVNYLTPPDRPKVSILMPSACHLDLLRPCMTALLERSTYPNFEILLAINEVRLRNPLQAAYLRELECDRRVRVLVYSDREFNFSWINNWAAAQAEGSIFCLMNDDVEVTTADWLEQFVARLRLDGVGAVGALLYYPDGTIQHAGVTIGLGDHGVAGHTYSKMPRGSAGYFGRAALEQDLSCVTAACMALRREAFEQIGGFNEELADAYNDVDLCMRLREKGWRIIWTPQVEHLHHESATVGNPRSPERKKCFLREVELMHQIWGKKLTADPFHNPNLSLHDGSISLAFPPRLPRLARSCSPAVRKSARSVQESGDLTPSPKRQAVLVLGMHRSGTSAVAGVINALGAAGPRTMQKADYKNPRGYFESLPFLIALDELLVAAGSCWDDWCQLDPQWFCSSAAEYHRQKIKFLLIEEFGDDPLIFIKDPRICLLVPFISSILAELSVECVAILPVRNPLEVGYSLKRRDGIALSKSILLWLRYVLEAEFHSRNMPRCFLAYEEFLTDWRSHVDRMAEQTGLTWPDRSDRSAGKIDEFLTADLRRERASFGEIDTLLEAAQWVRETYEALMAIVANGETQELLERLDAVRSKFDECCHIFGAAAAEQEIAAAGHAERLVAAVRKAVITERDALTAVRKTLSTERDSLAATQNNLVRESAAPTREHDRLGASYDAILNSRSWRLTAPLRALRRRFTR